MKFLALTSAGNVRNTNNLTARRCDNSGILKSSVNRNLLTGIKQQAFGTVISKYQRKEMVFKEIPRM
jgi:hypothetical protein|tara:strand:- start:380 stop:580 length:201 start_codon:yes stop_codon:yes gene_type:complete